MKKLAIITTHPIQYHAPLFAMLAAKAVVEIKVFYTWGASVMENKYDPGFKKSIQWDIPLLSGYEYEFLLNKSSRPGSDHFNGIKNPTLIGDIERWKADAVLVFGWSFSSHLRCLRYFHKKIPVLFRGDSTLLDDQNKTPIKLFLKKILLNWVYTYVDNALYVGKTNKAYFLKYGLKESQLIFAPHAIDNARFSAITQTIQREKLNIPATATVFLFAGKFESKKNPLLLIDAFNDLNYPDSYLVIVGNGELETQLKVSVENSSSAAATRIRFMDFQNQHIMPAVYKIADVFILPSQGPGETWGLSVNEAMASGLAIIVSDKCGCYPDLVEDGKNGYVFQSDHLPSLILSMKRVMNRIGELDKMGERSKEMIKSYSYEKFCEAIGKLMSQINLA